MTCLGVIQGQWIKSQRTLHVSGPRTVSVWIAFHHGTSRRTLQLRYFTWLTSFFNFYLFSVANNSLFLATPVYGHKIKLRRLHEQIVRCTQEQIWVAVQQISLLPVRCSDLSFFDNSAAIIVQERRDDSNLTTGANCGDISSLKLSLVLYVVPNRSLEQDLEQGNTLNGCGPDEPQGRVLD
jgi:hypothetical protein